MDMYTGHIEPMYSHYGCVCVCLVCVKEKEENTATISNSFFLK